MAVTPTTWNPLDKGAVCTLSNGNLTANGDQGSGWVRSVFGATSGKWYWEISSTGSRFPFLGVAQPSSDIGVGMAESAGNWAFYGPAPYKGHSGTYVAYGTQWTSSSQVLGVALDMDSGTIELFMDGVSMGVMYSGITGTIHAAATGDTSGTTSNSTANFGATAFAYTPPVGFNAGFGVLIATYALSGTVRDATNALASRKVVAKLENGTALGSTFSDPVTGAYSIPVTSGDPHTLVFYPADGENLNAIVRRGVLPIES